MQRPPLSARALCVAPLLLCAACATAPVRVPALRPAEVNLAAYPSVAVGGLGGRGDARALSDGLQDALAASRRFRVVDRGQISDALSALQLSASDAADPANAVRLGKMVSAAALISGEVDERYAETPDEIPYKDREGHKHVVRTLTGEAVVRATLRVVDVSTGRLLLARTYEDKKTESSRAEDARPQPVERAQLVQRARQMVIDRFLQAIVPYQEWVVSRFENDPDLPQLAEGIAWAERGDWEKAKERFASAAEVAGKDGKPSARKLGKARWDLGLAFEYSGAYDEAAALIRKAYEAAGEKDYLSELDAIEQLRADARRPSEAAGTR